MAWLRELKTPVLPSCSHALRQFGNKRISVIFENFFNEKDTPAGVFFYGTLGQGQQVLFVI
jgi:hypothetical protein